MFPGLWLVGITADAYRVADTPAKVLFFSFPFLTLYNFSVCVFWILTRKLIRLWFDSCRGEENLGKVLEIGGTEAWDFVKSKTKMLDWKFGI